MFKRILLLCLSVILLAIFVGCNNNVPGVVPDDIYEPTPMELEKEKVIEEAKVYLSQKYPDDEFTYSFGGGPEFGYSYYELIFITEKYGEQEFAVYALREEDTDNSLFEYYDNYHQYSMLSEAEEYFDSHIKECFGEDVEYRISLSSGAHTTRTIIENDYSFRDCLDSKMSFINMYIYSEKKIDDNQDNIYLFLDKILELDIYVDVSYICLNENSLYKVKNKPLEYISSIKNELFCESERYSVYGEITAYGKNSY